MLHIIVTLNDLPHHHGSHKAHNVGQRVDEAYQGGSKVVGIVQNCCLGSSIVKPIASCGYSQQEHGKGGLMAHKGGTYHKSKNLKEFSIEDPTKESKSWANG